jgi:nitrite reductase/ring-hydroxylating ferredoxin subunit
VRASCDGHGVFVFRRGSVVRVYDSRCPHESTDIPELALDGTRLTCPKHEWAFDIESGRCVAKGSTPLTLRPHRIEAGRVLVLW